MPVENNNNQNFGYDEQAEKLLSSFNEGASGEEEIKLEEAYAGIKTEDLDKALVEATGGHIKSAREIFGLTKVKQEYENLSKTHAELMAKANQNPFANEKAKALNELYSKGATDAEINNWWKIQNLDFESMSPLQKIKEALRLDHPNLSSEELDSYIETQYGASNEEDLDSAAMARIKIESREADAKLSGAKVKSNQTEKERQYAAQNREVEALAKSWGKVIDLRFGKQSNFSYEVEIPGSEEKFNIDFELPEGTRNQIAKQITLMAAQNRWPLEMDSVNKNAKSVYENLVFAFHGKEILARAVADAKKVAVKDSRSAFHGMKNGRGVETKQVHGVQNDKAFIQGQNFFNRKR